LARWKEEESKSRLVEEEGEIRGGTKEGIDGWWRWNTLCFFSLLLREWMGEYVIGGHAAYSSSGSSRSMMVLG